MEKDAENKVLGLKQMTWKEEDQPDILNRFLQLKFKLHTIILQNNSKVSLLLEFYNYIGKINVFFLRWYKNVWLGTDIDKREDLAALECTSNS